MTGSRHVYGPIATPVAIDNMLDEVDTKVELHRKKDSGCTGTDENNSEHHISQEGTSFSGVDFYTDDSFVDLSAENSCSQTTSYTMNSPIYSLASPTHSLISPSHTFTLPSNIPISPSNNPTSSSYSPPPPHEEHFHQVTAQPHQVIAQLHHVVITQLHQVTLQAQQVATHPHQCTTQLHQNMGTRHQHQSPHPHPPSDVHGCQKVSSAFTRTDVFELPDALGKQCDLGGKKYESKIENSM